MRIATGNKRDTLCLCIEHREWYRSQGYRVLPVGGNSGTCDLCNYDSRGYDYTVCGFISKQH